MKIYPEIAAAEGYITPHETNAEIRGLLGTLHSLDRDNFVPHAITSAKVAIDAWGTIVYDTRTTARTTVLTATHARNDEYPMPNTAGTPWRIEFSCQDGFIAGTFSVTCDIAFTTTPANARGNFWAGVRLDGGLISQTANGAHPCTSDGLECHFAVPIAAGSHYIDLVCGFAQDGISGETFTITWNHGILFAEVVSR